MKRRWGQPQWMVDNQAAISSLATYNSERARGLVHTDEWKAKMQKLQEEYDRQIREHYGIAG